MREKQRLRRLEVSTIVQAAPSEQHKHKGSSGGAHSKENSNTRDQRERREH